MKTLTTEDIKGLSSALRGRVITSEDDDYDEVRSIWNNMVDRFPSFIVQCRGTADVISCVKFAKKTGIDFSVRGGGHHIAGNCIRDNAMMIDLSEMSSVFVDSSKKIAYVEPGATLGDLDHETQAFALATSTGINSTTGIAGLTLGGGFGWLSRKHGMTIDNLLSAEVVTADGEAIIASATENTDLFWAIRGGGGNFGIITRFEFQLHDVGPEIFSGLIVLPFDNAKETLNQYREYTQTLPDEMSVWAVVRHAPPLPFLDEKYHGKKVIVMAMFYAGSEESAMEFLTPILSFDKPYGSFYGMMPYKNWQQIFDGLLTPGARNYWKSHSFKTLEDSTIDALVEYAEKNPSDQSEIFIAQMGGYTSRQPEGKTAYSAREAQYIMNVHARWDNASDDDKCIDWARAFFDKASEHAMEGAYVNFMTADESARVESAYGRNYQKLVKVKEKYDPSNIFNFNHNIRPKNNKE